MKTVYYYDAEGKFSSTEVHEGCNTLSIDASECEGVTDLRAYSTRAVILLPIHRYNRRHGAVINIACRSEFEAKCLISNHLDLDYHAEVTCSSYAYVEDSDYQKAVNDSLRDKLFKTHQFINLVPHFIVDSISPHTIKVSIHI